MITLQTTVSGGQIASEFRDDAEEFFWMLDDMTDHATVGFLKEISEFSAGTSADNIVTFLRGLATAIEDRE